MHFKILAQNYRYQAYLLRLSSLYKSKTFTSLPTVVKFQGQKMTEMLQWCAIENHQDSVYVVDWHSSRRPWRC